MILHDDIITVIVIILVDNYSLLLAIFLILKMRNSLFACRELILINRGWVDKMHRLPETRKEGQVTLTIIEINLSPLQI